MDTLGANWWNSKELMIQMSLTPLTALYWTHKRPIKLANLIGLCRNSLILL